MLRPYQSKIIDEARLKMRQGIKNILITSPTGSGKTILTAHMLKTAASKGMSSWFVVHRRELINQSMRAFHSVGVPFGVVSAGYPESKRMPVQIVGVQTVARRLNRYAKPSLIIYDESHHIAAGSWQKIHKQFPDAYSIGLTATPIRLDGAGLGNYFQDIVYGPSVDWLIKNNYLCKYKLYAPSHVKLDNLHTRMGDFANEELNVLIDKPTITGDAIKHYKKLCEGKRAVVFAVSIKHSEHIVEQFNSAGIPAEHVDGGTDTGERDRQIKRFSSGEIKILSNVDLFGEGFDLPAMEAVIMLRPTQSLGMYLQQCGRVLRTSPGKNEAIILDHVGNCERHGLPDEDRQWKLTSDKIKKSKNEISSSVRVCPKCFAAMFSGVIVCSYCGYNFEKQSRKIEEKDGELVEVDAETIRRKKKIEQGKCETLDELIEVGKRRGYKRPYLWAQYVFNARQSKKINK